MNFHKIAKAIGCMQQQYSRLRDWLPLPPMCDHAVTIESMTPETYRRDGQNLHIAYGIHDTLFGKVLLAQTGKKICWLSFLDSPDKGKAPDELHQWWSLSERVADHTATANTVKRIFSHQPKKFTLLVQGKDSQIRVWNALIKIPHGQTTTYGDVAKSIGQPGSAQAVGGALSGNNIACLIPCHRVIKSTGEPGGYRWGLDRKLALLAAEALQPAGTS